MIFICHYWSEMHFYLRDKCFIDKGLERKFLLPLLVRDVSVPQRCMLGRVTSVVWVLPLEKLFPVMHPRMEHGIMRKVWIEKAYWEHTRVF